MGAPSRLAMMVEGEQAERGWMSKRAPIALTVLLLGLCALAFLAWPTDGVSKFQELTNVKIDSESPIKSIKTKKLGQNNFAVSIKTEQGLNTGPMLPPKNKLGRWRDVKWWSDDFTKKYYPKHWSLIHKGEPIAAAAASSSSGAAERLSPAQRAAKRKLAARKAVILKIAKVNEGLMKDVSTLAVHFGSMATRNITVDVAPAAQKAGSL